MNLTSGSRLGPHEILSALFCFPRVNGGGALSTLTAGRCGPDLRALLERLLDDGAGKLVQGDIVGLRTGIAAQQIDVFRIWCALFREGRQHP